MLANPWLDRWIRYFLSLSYLQAKKAKTYLDRFNIKLGASQMSLVVKNPPAKARDIREVGSIQECGRSPGRGHGNPLRYSCLENPMDRGTWKAPVHRFTKSWAPLKQISMHAYIWPPLLNLTLTPTPSCPFRCHRAPGWASCVLQQLPTSYLFYIQQSICFSATLRILPTLSFPHCLQVCSQHFYPCPANRYIYVWLTLL